MSTPSSDLSRLYKAYVLGEAILINVVGFLTLVFQCSLQRLEAAFLHRHPDCPQALADVLFGHFWLRDSLNCDTAAAHALTCMVAGWLFIASTLQIFVNFDSLRRSIFPTDENAPRGVKLICLYAFFLCDWFWVVLMFYFRDVITSQQIIGSAIDIIIRLYFVADTDRIFSSSSLLQKTHDSFHEEATTPEEDSSAAIIEDHDAPLLPLVATTPSSEPSTDTRRRNKWSPMDFI